MPSLLRSLSPVALGILALGMAGSSFAADTVDPKDTPNMNGPSSYEYNVAYGSNTIQLRMTEDAGTKSYSSVVNGAVIASAKVPVASNNAAALSQHANFVKASARAVADAGGAPQDFGLIYSDVKSSTVPFDSAAIANLLAHPMPTNGTESISVKQVGELKK